MEVNTDRMSASARVVLGMMQRDPEVHKHLQSIELDERDDAPGDDNRLTWGDVMNDIRQIADARKMTDMDVFRAFVMGAYAWEAAISEGAWREGE